jgi:uncharacterized protein involved in exopolysaccharide biosynthesis
MEELNFNDRNGHSANGATLRDVARIAFRHGPLIVLSFLGILGGAILTATLQPSRYEAEMKILVKRDRVEPLVTPQANSNQPVNTEVGEAELNSEVELLRSSELLEKTVLACDLQHRDDSMRSKLSGMIGLHPATPKESVRVANAVATLSKDLKVEVLKKTNLIAVGYGSPDAQLSARVLKTLGDLYLQKHVTVHRPPGAFDFFQKETKQYRGGLNEAQASLVNFNRGNGVVSASVEKGVALAKLAEFDGTLRQTQAGIAETQQRIHTLEQEVTGIPNRMVTQVRNSDDATLLSQLRSNLLTLEQKRTELLGKFEPGYRLVQEVDAQIAQTRNALAAAEKSQLHEETTDRDPTYEWARAELVKAKADLAGMEARAQATAGAVRSYLDAARSLEQKEIVQDDLTRTVKASEENYLLYLRKEEEARISDALDRGRILNVVVAEAARVPSLASSHRSQTVLLGFLLATLVSIGMAYGSERLDSTFRTPAEVESVLDIPVLAALPQNGKNGSHANGHNGHSNGNGNGNGKNGVAANGKHGATVSLS